MYTVHGVNLSPFVRKVRAVLEEKGVAYELNPVMPFAKTPELLAMNPLGKIPVLQDDDFELPDSSCIGLYLERREPAVALYPADDRAFGWSLFLEEFADTRVVEVTAPVFVQRVVNQRLMKLEADEALIAEVLSERVPPVFDWLEARVPEGDAIVGGRFSVADIALVSPFVNFRHGGASVDAARWPKLAAYVEHVCARPSFAKLIAEEESALSAA